MSEHTLTATQAVPIPSLRPTSKVREPYVGPRDIHEGESLYGRDRELEELADTLLAERIVLCHAPSGAGKTSLVQARLIPKLRGLGFFVLGPTKVGRELDPEVRTAKMNRYVQSALVGLEELACAHRSVEDGGQWEPVPLTTLAGMTIAEYVDRRESELPPGQRIVLIVDQFEEILSLDEADVAEKTEFFRQMGAALRPLNRWALIVVHEEYAASLDPYVHLVPTGLQRHYVLGLLEKNEAKQAIAQPAADAGVTFADDAVEQLIDNLLKAARPGSPAGQLGRFVEPVLLQVVCRRLWTRLPAGTTNIGREVIDSVSDVDNAIADYYAESVHSVSEKAHLSERAIRRWIGESLIHGNVRAQVEVGDEARYGLTSDATNGLRAVYLIRVDPRRASGDWYELAHDRLIGPIKADNERWLRDNMSVVERCAETWYSTGRSSRALLRGNALREARGWVAQHPDEITSLPRVEEFVAASVARQHYLWREIWLVILFLAATSSVYPLWSWYKNYKSNSHREATWKQYGLTQQEIDSAHTDLYVTYLSRPQDTTIANTLQELHYTLDVERDPNLKPTTDLPNQIRYGRDVDSTAVKLVALALMKADPRVRIRYICPEPDFWYIADSRLVVRYSKASSDSTPISEGSLRTEPAIRQRRNGKVLWHCPTN